MLVSEVGFAFVFNYWKDGHQEVCENPCFTFTIETYAEDKNKL